MEFEIARRFTFDAAHHLPWHAGACRKVHGHTYTLDVVVRGPLDVRGVVVDFADLDAAVRLIVERLDHTDLNLLFENPTAELIAADVYSRLIDAGLAVSEVVLWETPRNSVRVTA